MGNSATALRGIFLVLSIVLGFLTIALTGIRLNMSVYRARIKFFPLYMEQRHPEEWTKLKDDNTFSGKLERKVYSSFFFGFFVFWKFITKLSKIDGNDEAEKYRKKIINNYKLVFCSFIGIPICLLIVFSLLL